jgi:hypothetical protein
MNEQCLTLAWYVFVYDTVIHPYVSCHFSKAIFTTLYIFLGNSFLYKTQELYTVFLYKRNDTNLCRNMNVQICMHLHAIYNTYMHNTVLHSIPYFLTLCVCNDGSEDRSRKQWGTIRRLKLAGWIWRQLTIVVLLGSWRTLTCHYHPEPRLSEQRYQSKIHQYLVWMYMLKESYYCF